jgi:repressor LexA
MRNLSPSLRLTLEAIQEFIESHGLPPTYDEVGEIRGIKGPSVFEQVQQLIELGYLRKARRRSRNLILVEPPPTAGEVAELASVPVIGSISAGQPLFCEENVIGEVLVERRLVQHSKCFALKVEGESMKDADILHGDFVIVRQQPSAENGEIVVALVNGEATVKRLRVFPDRWELEPDNPDFETIHLRPDDELRIVGKVIGVFRKSSSS